MKPSKGLSQKKRLGDIEKAAKKEADKIMLGSQYGREVIIDTLVLFATRHGAKVRRETLKEAARVDCTCRGLFRLAPPCSCSVKIANDILSLTPRGPEKGRRAK